MLSHILSRFCCFLDLCNKKVTLFVIPTFNLLMTSKDSSSISMSLLHEACGDEKNLTDLLQIATNLQCKLTQEVIGAEISSVIETVS